jgi:hypothetical protein
MGRPTFRRPAQSEGFGWHPWDEIRPIPSLGSLSVVVHPSWPSRLPSSRLRPGEKSGRRLLHDCFASGASSIAKLEAGAVDRNLGP